MTIETDDAQAADVLASIKSSALYLQRCVRCSFAYTSNDISPSGQATWWPSPDAALRQNSSQRHIMGEIHLRKDLQPSTAIKEFQVEVCLCRGCSLFSTSLMMLISTLLFCSLPLLWPSVPKVQAL